MYLWIPRAHAHIVAHTQQEELGQRDLQQVTKEPHLSAKEPHLSAKEPCMFAHNLCSHNNCLSHSVKEPCISSDDLHFFVVIGGVAVISISSDDLLCANIRYVWRTTTLQHTATPPITTNIAVISISSDDLLFFTIFDERKIFLGHQCPTGRRIVQN